MIFWVGNIVFLGTIVFLLYKNTRTELSTFTFTTALVLRILAGIATGLIFYKLYPGGDSFGFFNTALVALEENSYWSIISGNFETERYSNQPRVIFFIQILSGVVHLSGDSYWISIFYFSLISFVASIYFVVQFNRIFPTYKKLTYICFLYLPSVLFWSSGILKDTISYSAFIIAIVLALKFYKEDKFKFWEIALGAVSLLVLFKIKHYLLIIYLMFAGIVISIYFFKKLNGALRWSLSISTVIVFLVLTQFVHPYLTVSRIPQTIFDNNQTITSRTRIENQLDILVTEPSWKSVLHEVPKSAYTGLFRPTIFDKTPIVGIGHKIENFILVSLGFFTLLILIKRKPEINWELILPAVFCIGVLATLMAMTTPNLGTLVRYRNAYLPFLFLLLGLLPFQYLTSKSS